MLTLYINKKFIGDREQTFKVRSLKSDPSGYTWHVVFETGQLLDTCCVSKGRDSILKKDIKVLYKEENENKLLH